MNRLQIANSALLRVGDRAIQSFDENSSTARLVKLQLERAIHETLSESGWVSCRKRVILVPLSESPLFGYEYQFQLPADYIRNIEVDVDYFTIEGKLLLCDAPTVNMVYIAPPINMDDMDPLLAGCVSLKLAMMIAYAKTESKTLVESVQLEYERLMLPKARGINALEKVEESPMAEIPWIQSRYNSPS